MTLRAASGGESGTAFWATDRAGSITVVKVMADTPDVADGLRVLPGVVTRLRDLGYPAARIYAAGRIPGLVFWVQERLPGTALDPGPGTAAVARLLPELIGLNDAQAGLGTGTDGWPGLVTRTLITGGDGYCVHSTLAARADTRELLAAVRRIGERCGPDIPAGTDFVHYDFTPANLLSDGTAITGVIDVNPPALTGDRAFDLATLLYYCYDHDGIREGLRARVLELTDPRAARAYLAHLVLRQVDWSLRYPGSRLVTLWPSAWSDGLGDSQLTRETIMALQVTTIMLGVSDLARSKKFYSELGATVDKDFPVFVSLSLGDGSSSLALYERAAAAEDAGVSAEGSGFTGVSFHYIVTSRETVDEVIASAVAAGGAVVKEAAGGHWGGYSGYFSDPDGYLWKVATPA